MSTSPRTPATARAEIGAMYDEWGRARVELNAETMEALLAPEFHVLLDGREIPRETFLHDVSQARPGSRLTRFDAEVLAVQRGERGWTVIITEKLEFELSGADGETDKLCSFWVTRDGCREQDGKWLVTSSEAIGYENWPAGTRPPFPSW